MTPTPPDRFAGDIARRYDEDEATMFDAAVLGPTLDVLAGLAGGGAACEFAIGTGRVALPLRERGVAVSGVELSPDIIAQLRAKPGGADVEVVVGDMTTARVPGEFALVYLVFNTIGNLTTQDAQVACFANAAAHLAPGGSFLIEVGVPQVRGLPPGETAVVDDLTPGHVGIDEYDVVDQGLVSHHYTREPDGRLRYGSIPLRYAWPAEFDLMAQLAGLRLRSRWADWQHTPFTSESTAHVSVWEKPFPDPSP